MKSPSCRFCSANPDQQSIKGEFVFGGTAEHKFWHCSVCDLVYLFPVPSREDEERFYRDEFEKYMDSRSGEDRDWTGPEAHVASNQDHVARRMGYLTPHLRVPCDLLEFGCSSGFMLNAFREVGANCCGVEPSSVFLDYLHKQGYQVYQSQDDLLKENPDQRFDLIVHFFVLEHVRNPVAFLRGQLDLLKPGGRVVFEIPCVTDPLLTLYETEAFNRFYWSIAHHYYFSPTSLGKQLSTLDCEFELLPDQRYDLGNHVRWMLQGRPGGQGTLSHVFGETMMAEYCENLKDRWLCDTLIGVLRK